VTTQRRTLTVDDRELAALRTPRDGVLLERAVGPDHFELEEGALHHWVRSLAVESDGNGTHTVTETVDWKLDVPIFWVFVWIPFWFHVRSGMGKSAPWWAPGGRLDQRAGHVVGLLGTLALVNGFLGTVIGQTLTFAADEFCGEFETVDGLRSCIDPAADESARADVFTIVRIAIVLSLGLTIAADRFGRRSAIRAAVTISCVATAAGAIVPSLGLLAVTQIFARGLATGLAILIAVVAAEELPPKSRAYGISVLVLLAGLGSGMVVWILPLADVAEWGWRLVYATAIVFLPAAFWASSKLPTTRRFATNTNPSMRAALRELTTHPLFRRRLALLASAALLAALFATPASQFDNQYLRDELGFSATRISLFTLVTSTPVGLGVLAGGMLADRVGRRPIGALGTAIGAALMLWSFFASGLPLWFIRAGGTILGSGLAIPALGVYGPELFPTRLRSSANGLIIAAGVIGSVIGLQVVGRLAERWDAFGPALAVMVFGPALVVVMLLTLYPETANQTLETINDEPELAD